MKKIVLLFVIMLVAKFGLAQPLFSDNFDYSLDSKLTDNGWTAHSGSGTNPVKVVEGLTYSGYAGSNIGNAAKVDNLGGEDVNRGFNVVSGTGKTVYYSFLIKVTDGASSKTGDYVIHIGNRNSPTNFTSFAARLFVRIVSDKVNFGVSNNSTGTYSSTNFNKNQVYLCMLKYVIDSQVKLWVDTAGVPSSEIDAGTPLLTVNNSGSLSQINAIGLRQGSSTTSVQCVIDGIRIDTSWSNAPLPVELTMFTAKYLNSGVILNWQTATEINNNKFVIERSINEGEYEAIAEVPGYGNSNSIKDYTYTDKQTKLKGNYCYRLKQVDNDGTYKYSQVVNVTVGNLDNYELAQNYPNPFNPTTNINFTMPKAGSVKITLFNSLGEEVQTIFNGVKEAGFHTVQFNASGLPSGIYFYQMTSEGFTQTKKMIIAK